MVGKELLWKNAALASLVLLASQMIFLRLHPMSSSSRKEPSLPSSFSAQNPIFVMGLPRSGSEAIHEYFDCLGVPSAHYCCRKDGRRSSSIKFPCPEGSFPCGDCILNNMKSVNSNQLDPLEGCGTFQVWSRFDIETSEPYSWFLPQHFTLPILHDAYPTSTFILPYRRDASTWAKSVLHWYSLTRRLFVAFDLEYYPSPIPPPPPESAKVSADEILRDMQKAIDERIFNRTEHARKEQLLEQVYLTHIAKIRQWARTYPTHGLVEINIENEQQSTQVLQSMLSLPKSNKCKMHFDADKYDNDWKDFSFSIPESSRD